MYSCKTYCVGMVIKKQKSFFCVLEGVFVGWGCFCGVGGVFVGWGARGGSIIQDGMSRE